LIFIIYLYLESLQISPFLLTSLIYIAFISTFAGFDNFKCRTRQRE